jgi:hypothetical protein
VSILAATAAAQGPTAVTEAVGQAVAGLGGTSPALVLVFPDADGPVDDAVSRATAAAPGSRIAGMTSRGIISSVGDHARGCLATAFSPEVSVGIGIASEASRDPREAGRIAAAQAAEGLDLEPGHAVLLLFVDPRSGDEAGAIDGAYSVIGGAVPLAGGGANGDVPALIADGRASADAVVAVALRSPERVVVGVSHGCQPTAEPAIATRTDGRVLLELNGRPAEEVYLEGFGCGDMVLDDPEFEAFAVLHPLGQPEMRGQMRLRHVHGRAPGGGLACATPIPPNAAIWFTEQTAETIVESAERAVGETLEQLPGVPRAGLVFDCAARRRALGDSVEEETRALRSAFGEVAPIGGLYTRGEVGRVRGAKGDRNHAIVVVAFA